MRRRPVRRLILAIVCIACFVPVVTPYRAVASGSLTWNTSITVGPIALARPAVSIGQDGNIYVFGGTLGDNTVFDTTFIYQPSTNSWSLGATMPVQREGAQAITLPDGRIAVLGGGTNCAYSELCTAGTVYNRVDVYTPSTNSWGTLAPMQSPRYRFAAVLYHGKIYAIGGSDGTQPLASLEQYDPVANSWSDAASLPQALVAPAAVVDPSDRIDVAGGFDGVSPTTPYNTLYRYDGNSWASDATLLQATQNAGATIGADGQVYVVGGFANGWISTVQTFNPSTDSWSFAPSLPSPTCCMGAVTIGSGQIYVVTGGGSASSQVAVYGPSISLSPPGGVDGSITTVAGTSFAPSANVSLYWGSASSGILLGNGTTDANGSLVAPISVTVPATATPGSYTITAIDDQSGYPATAQFTVAGAGPSVTTVNPRSGSYARSIAVTGANFRAGETVNLFWDTLSATPIATTTVSANGSFSAAFHVPQAPLGVHRFIALGRTSHFAKGALFTIQPETFLSRTTGSAGSLDSISGFGFAPNQSVSAYWKTSGPGGILLGSVTTNAKGSFTGAGAFTFTVPSGVQGSYNVIGMGLHNGGVSILTVTP